MLCGRLTLSFLGSLVLVGLPTQLTAQTTQVPRTSIPIQGITDPTKPPSQQPLPELTTPKPLPPAKDLLIPQPDTPNGSPVQPSATLVINAYKVMGSTVFSPAELETVTRPFTTPVLGRPASFADILQARSAITELYGKRGYVTSGAVVPPQPVTDGVAVIQVIEGSVEAIQITGTRRLKPGYINSRLEIATKAPFNQPRLLTTLQLLQLDPLIQSISADLQASTRPGTNILVVKVVEAKTLATQVELDNARSPSVGSSRRRLSLTQANLLGFGDGLSVGYTNTDGSNGFDAQYTLPLGPRDTTLSLSLGKTRSRVIEKPFDILDITADSSYAELTLRQPLFRKPTEELALALTLSHQFNQTFLGVDDIGGFPLSAGSDDQGRTRTTVLRFAQEWNRGNGKQVLAVRSQFSLGIGGQNSATTAEGPSSRFFTWRGQAQWVRLLAPDTLLLLRGDLQLSDRSLLGLEQFGIGGQQSVRGYRQDVLLTDSGLAVSAEVRLPVLRVPRIKGILQVTPFLDVGRGWNRKGPDPDPGTLIGTGIGLLWRQGNNLTARLDWGIPLVSFNSNNSERRTWQENGVYFSLTWNPF